MKIRFFVVDQVSDFNFIINGRSEIFR